MKRVLSLIVMFALATVMAAPGVAYDGTQPHFETDAVGHVAVSPDITIADILDDCCAAQDGAMHHATGGCAMDCAAAIPVVAIELTVTDAGLGMPLSSQPPAGIASARFRPPIGS